MLLVNKYNNTPGRKAQGKQTMTSTYCLKNETKFTSPLKRASTVTIRKACPRDDKGEKFSAVAKLCFGFKSDKTRIVMIFEKTQSVTIYGNSPN